MRGAYYIPDFVKNTERIQLETKGQSAEDSTISEAALTLSTAPIWSIPCTAPHINEAMQQKKVSREN